MALRQVASGKGAGRGLVGAVYGHLVQVLGLLGLDAVGAGGQELLGHVRHGAPNGHSRLGPRHFSYERRPDRLATLLASQIVGRAHVHPLQLNLILTRRTIKMMLRPRHLLILLLKMELLIALYCVHV